MIFKKTMDLRWSRDVTGIKIDKLQQEWISTEGESEWRDIKTETE